MGALILNAASMIERPALVSFASNSRQESTNFESPAPTIPASCINTQQNSQASVVADATVCLSFCLGPFSQDLISIHEDDAKHQVRSYGGGPDVQPGQLYENDALREIGISPLEPLKPPAMEALEFLVDCTTMIAATVQGALIPAKFYVELLQALVQDGNTELVLRTLDIGKTKVKIGTKDMISVARLEDIARRTIQGKRSETPFDVEKNVMHDEMNIN